MKICLISNLYPPYARGGAEYVVNSTVKGMLERGHQVIVITTSPDGNSFGEEKNLKIYRYLPRNLFFYTQAHKHNSFMRLLWHIIDTFHISSARYVKRILKQEKPDVVHTHNLMGTSFLIPRMIRKLGIRHLHTVHDVQLVEPSGIILKLKEGSRRYNGLPIKIYTKIMKNLFGSPNVVISPSQFLLDFYVSRGFFKKSKKVMLRNPVSTQKIDRISNETARVSFLYLGQIEEHKGVIFLIETFLEMFGQNNTAAELNVVGDGSQMKKIREMTHNNKNIVLHGRVGREKLPGLFGGTNVTIVPSLCYENSPTVIFESLSFGVPVLASRVEGVAELIREGENGFTFETGNTQSLKNKIKWCLENKAKLNDMSKKTAQSLVGLSQGDYIGKLDELYLES